MKSFKPQSVLRGTALLFSGRLLSRSLGLLREVISASLFGSGWAMDCYNIAFTVINSLRQLFSERFLIPLVPTFFREKNASGERQALLTLRLIATRLNLFALSLSVLLFFAARPIVQLLAPGFSSEQVHLSTILVRWFAIGGIAFVLHRFYAGLHISFFRYQVLAFSPLLMNIGAIAAMVFFASQYGVISLAAGISLGFIAYFVVIVVSSPHHREILKPLWKNDGDGMRRYLVMLLPLLAVGGVEQIQVFVDRALASGLPEGALSAQGYALRLMHMFSEFSIGTFGTVIFPVFSSLAAGENKEAFVRNFSLAFQAVVLALSLGGAIIIALALPLIRLLLERGAFTYEDSVLTSQLIAYYAAAYIAQSFFIVVIRGFQAHGNTRTPMFTMTIAAGVMIALDFLLVGRMGIHGLALALAIGYSLNLVLLYILFARYLNRSYVFQNLRIFVLGVTLSVVLGLFISAIWNFCENYGLVGSTWGRLIGVVLLSGAAVSIYIGIIRILRLEVFVYIVDKFRKKGSAVPDDVGDDHLI